MAGHQLRVGQDVGVGEQDDRAAGLADPAIAGAAPTRVGTREEAQVGSSQTLNQFLGAVGGNRRHTRRIS